jgi:hypothetical protein
VGTGGFSPGIKRPGREADHWPPSSAEVKKLYLHSPVCLPSACRIKHRNNFTFTMFNYGLPREIWTGAESTRRGSTFKSTHTSRKNLTVNEELWMKQKRS